MSVDERGRLREGARGRRGVLGAGESLAGTLTLLRPAEVRFLRPGTWADVPACAEVVAACVSLGVPTVRIGDAEFAPAAPLDAAILRLLVSRAQTRTARTSGSAGTFPVARARRSASAKAGAPAPANSRRAGQRQPEGQPPAAGSARRRIVGSVGAPVTPPAQFQHEPGAGRHENGHPRTRTVRVGRL